MDAKIRFAVVALTACFSATLASAQTPPARDIVAAKVNGQAIPELMIYRSLLRVPPDKHEQARKDILNYLIDTAIVDQYLLQLKIQVEAKEVDESIRKIKDEAARDKQNFEDLLKKLVITEPELRVELAAALRWDKFVLQQGTDKVLQQFFTQNPAMFDGSQVRVRHILIPVKDNNKEAALAKITGLKKGIDAEVAQAVAKVPSGADALTREKDRCGALEQAFIKSAQTHSTCPSAKDGGDLKFFPRVGAMVEPFARVAFALKPYQLSDPVQTDFGYHLILVVEQKEGRAMKFEQVKPFVQEVYGERLREAVLAAYKPKARVEIMQRR